MSDYWINPYNPDIEPNGKPKEPKAYWNESGNQALTKRECEEHGIDYTKLEPLYTKETK